MHMVRCSSCTKKISRITNRCDAVHMVRCGAYGPMRCSVYAVPMWKNISEKYPRRIGQGLNDVSCILGSMFSSLLGLPNPAWVFLEKCFFPHASMLFVFVQKRSVGLQTDTMHMVRCCSCLYKKDCKPMRCCVAARAVHMVRCDAYGPMLLIMLAERRFWKGVTKDELRVFYCLFIYSHHQKVPRKRTCHLL